MQPVRERHRPNSRRDEGGVKMTQREVSHFLVVPPMKRLDEFVNCRDRLADWLGKRYPRYTFEVAGLAPIQDDERFVIIPIMNYVSPDGDSLMCAQPQAWLMNEIARACDEFRPDKLVSFAA